MFDIIMNSELAGHQKQSDSFVHLNLTIQFSSERCVLKEDEINDYDCIRQD